MFKYISMLTSCFISIVYAGALKANIEVMYPNIDGIGGESIGFHVLELALEKSGQDYLLKLHGPSVNQRSAKKFVERGILSVFDAGYQAELEQRFEPIYLPIDRGILGWRLLIIHQQNIDKFAAVKNLADLTQYIAGQGVGWGDIAILENAGIKVIKANRVSQLINKVEKQRFDMFPLGANEVYGFLDKYSSNDNSLVVDKNLVLVYPFGRFFYVRKGNTTLANTIKLGMETALVDGSLQALLENHQHFKDAFSKANLKQRKHIDIKTPNLTEKFKNIDPKWWYSL
ncbi:hypothetical protein [Spartinivicinus poritis]|uniref:Solute-binding protein family 3/N-terminal domain-containing protein n=1 Tax=Spartinivicinus poritis TaxID=2994640 RepID=A0ABT5UBN6_9GAMM|nr:hypothetical protein [Spartinivicinus sp. A2-2]MDE1463793.1 hypothetical protein [Spartinivicinus sp. A2-2]